MITQQEIKDVLDYDPLTGKLYWKKRPLSMFNTKRNCNSWNAQYAGKEAFISDNGRGYRQGAINNKLYKAHRIIFMMVYGHWPDQIDHIDQNRSNNSLQNLREVSNQDNQKNARKRADNTSGTTGVTWNKVANAWYARIGVNGNKVTIGRFDTKQEAVKARLEAEKFYNYHPNHGKG